MFGIGSTELLVIFIVALVVLGPKSLPGIAKTLGKVMGEFRRVSTDLQRTMNAEIAQEEHDQRKKEAEKELFGSDDDKDIPKDYAPDASTAKVQPDSDVEKSAETDVPAEKLSPVQEAVAKAGHEAGTESTAPMSSDLTEKVTEKA